MVGCGLSSGRLLGRVVERREPRLTAAAGWKRECASLSCLRDDLECSAHLPWPQRGVGRNGRRARHLACRLHHAGTRAIHHSAHRVSSLIVSTYTFLTAAELWHERRKTVLR